MCVCEHRCQTGNEDPSQSPPQFHAKFTGSDTHAHTHAHTYSSIVTQKFSEPIAHRDNQIICLWLRSQIRILLEDWHTAPDHVRI